MGKWFYQENPLLEAVNAKLRDSVLTAFVPPWDERDYRTALWRSFAKEVRLKSHPQLGQVLMEECYDRKEIPKIILISGVGFYVVMIVILFIVIGAEHMLDVLPVIGLVAVIFGLITLPIMYFDRSVFVFFGEKGMLVEKRGFLGRGDSDTIHSYADITAIEAKHYEYFRNNPFVYFSRPLITEWEYHIHFKNGEPLVLRGRVFLGSKIDFWLTGLLNSAP